MNETLRTVDGRAVLWMQRRLAHPPEKVWRALTDPTELSQWFPATVSMAPAVGAEVSFDFGDGASPDGEILALEPAQVFEFTWHGEVLRFDLQADGDGCLLTFTHTFDDRPGAASFASGWRGCLDALGQLIAGEPVAHVRPSAELHDSFVEAFGLDEGTIEQTSDGGWRARFERQLTQPAERAWETLVADPPEVGGAPPPALTTGAVPAGRVTSVEPPGRLSYEWRHADQPAGEVRWELSDERGTGHGARLVLTVIGPGYLAGHQHTVLSAFPQHLQGVASRLRHPG